MQNFDLERELRERSDTDWQFGATSKPSIVSIPISEREQWLPKGELQYSSKTDFMDCASRSPINHLEALFTYHYYHDMKPENKKWLEQKGYVVDGQVTFSDRFIAVLSKTTRQGNSLKSPLQAIENSGLIPKKLLPKGDMAWEEYHNPEAITQEMKDLGLEFKARFPIKYEQVKKGSFVEAIKNDMLGVAGYAWPKPVNGVYPKTDEIPNHAFLLYNLPAYQAYDNYLDDNRYNDFTKTLAPDYDFFDYGYRVYIEAENTEEAVKISLLKTIIEYYNIIIGLLKKKPMKTLLQIINEKIGTDASPANKAPSRLACAETVSSILREYFKQFNIDFPIIIGTPELAQKLEHSGLFERVYDPQAEDIIISATGTTPTPNKLPNGHTGFYLDNNRIVSNSSETGTLEQNYTRESWRDLFHYYGGYPVRLYRLKPIIS